jgi:membrane-associated phospholipid phosphatase
VRAARATLCLSLLFASAGARADLAREPHNVRWSLEAPLSGGLLVGGIVYGALMPVDTTRSWRRELWPFLDERVKRNYSASAAATSDALIAVTVALPVGLELGRGANEEMGKSTFIYVETLTASLVLNTVVKYAVRRPRPYTYSERPAVQASLAAARARRSRDSHLSFYSGHASTAFAAAVAGSYLYAQRSTSSAARATVWGIELALAAATANLRVRAGKHFWSDVMVGAVVGAGMGIGIPLAHGGPRVSLSAAEIATIAAAPIAGLLASQLLPFAADATVPLDAPRPLSWLQPRPWLLPGGAGVALGGLL